MFYYADPDDPDADPAALLFHSAQSGSIPGMAQAIKKDPCIIFASDIFLSRSALHFAAASCNPFAVDAVRWLLDKGIPWSVPDAEASIAEDLARVAGNEECRKVLRNWAVQREYELHYMSNSDQDHPDEGKPFSILRMDKRYPNELYCNSRILFTNPHGAPEDEVALVTDPDGDGIMMEWERPIMRETARLLLDEMPTSGLRVLNIGFGIGMIDTYFQDAHPAEHVIIEGHPTCLSWMRRTGWYERPGVSILEGRWQDFFKSQSSMQSDIEPSAHHNHIDNPQLLSLPGTGPKDGVQQLDIGKFDVVYFDTFSEGYRGHFDFIKHVPRLLRGPGSRFSFFHGHAAKRETEYKIYAEVARLHHNDLGMNTEWFPAHVDNKAIWYNISNRGRGSTATHPQLIPICALAPTVPRRIVPGVGWKCDP